MQREGDPGQPLTAPSEDGDPQAGEEPGAVAGRSVSAARANVGMNEPSRCHVGIVPSGAGTVIGCPPALVTAPLSRSSQ